MSNNDKQKQGDKGCTWGDKGKEKEAKRREGKGRGRMLDLSHIGCG